MLCLVNGEHVTRRAGPLRGGADGGLVLFRLAGVPVVLAPSWWIGSLLVVVLYAPLVARVMPGADTLTAWLLAAAFAVLLGLSVLAHELGHCLVALRLRLPVRRLRLYLLGGLAEISRTPVRSRDEAAVAAAGPLVSVVLAALFGLLLLAMPAGGPVWLLVLECGIANAAVGVFNVLPGLPLDGGRMLRAGVWALSGRRSWGTRAAVVGAGIVALGLLIWALLGLATASPDRRLRLGVCVITGWFVVAGAASEFAAEERRSWPAGVALAELVRPVLQLPAEIPVADALTAASGHGVVLVRANGVAVGLLDEVTGRRLAQESPASPAEFAADPIAAETVVLDSEPTWDIAERIRDVSAWQFLVVDGDGKPAAVLHRQDLHTALSEHGRG